MVDRAAMSKQAGDAFIAGDVGRNRLDPQLRGRRIQALGVTRGDDDVGALLLGEFGGRKTDTGRAPDDDDLFTCSIM